MKKFLTSAAFLVIICCIVGLLLAATMPRSEHEKKIIKKYNSLIKVINNSGVASCAVKVTAISVNNQSIVLNPGYHFPVCDGQQVTGGVLATGQSSMAVTVTNSTLPPPGQAFNIFVDDGINVQVLGFVNSGTYAFNNVSMNPGVGTQVIIKPQVPPQP